MNFIRISILTIAIAYWLCSCLTFGNPTTMRVTRNTKNVITTAVSRTTTKATTSAIKSIIGNAVPTNGQNAKTTVSRTTTKAIIGPDAIDQKIRSFTQLTISKLTPLIENSASSQHAFGDTLRKVDLDATTQKNLSNALDELFKKQQAVADIVSSYVHRRPRTKDGRKRRDTNPNECEDVGECGCEVQKAARHLIGLINSTSEIPFQPLAVTPDGNNISQANNSLASPFQNFVDLMLGRKAQDAQGRKHCINAGVLRTIASFADEYYHKTSGRRLTIKTILGGTSYPLMNSDLHNKSTGVDFLCADQEGFYPGACSEIVNMCLKKSMRYNATQLYTAIYAENFGCSSDTLSIFGSVHCTLVPDDNDTVNPGLTANDDDDSATTTAADHPTTTETWPWATDK